MHLKSGFLHIELVLYGVLASLCIVLLWNAVACMTQWTIKQKEWSHAIIAQAVGFDALRNDCMQAPAHGQVWQHEKAAYGWSDHDTQVKWYFKNNCLYRSSKAIGKRKHTSVIAHGINHGALDCIMSGSCAMQLNVRLNSMESVIGLRNRQIEYHEQT